MTHQSFMSLALALAEKGRYSVSPNPMVGCIIVNQGKIVGQGYHQKFGDAHAEVNALAQAGLQAENATVYVTLEPCCHFGKTPPCVEALIKAKVKAVHIATLDPNPLVYAKGVNLLKKAGIQVIIGEKETEARQLNEIFFYFIKEKKPFVICKWAMSLDGRTRVNKNDDRSLTSDHANQFTHELRQRVDAILIGSNTLIEDNPLLTVRSNAKNTKNTKIIKHPLRIVMTTQTQLPLHLNIFNSKLPSKTIIASTSAINMPKHIENIVVKQKSKQQIDLQDLLPKLAQLNISSLLVEGGMTVHENFLEAQLVNKVLVYVAPFMIGNLKRKEKWSNISSKQFGPDFCLMGYQ